MHVMWGWSYDCRLLQPSVCILLHDFWVVWLSQIAFCKCFLPGCPWTHHSNGKLSHILGRWTAVSQRVFTSDRQLCLSVSFSVLYCPLPNPSAFCPQWKNWNASGHHDSQPIHLILSCRLLVRELRRENWCQVWKWEFLKTALSSDWLS